MLQQKRLHPSPVSLNEYIGAWGKLYHMSYLSHPISEVWVHCSKTFFVNHGYAQGFRWKTWGTFLQRMHGQSCSKPFGTLPCTVIWLGVSCGLDRRTFQDGGCPMVHILTCTLCMLPIKCPLGKELHQSRPSTGPSKNLVGNRKSSSHLLVRTQNAVFVQDWRETSRMLLGSRRMPPHVIFSFGTYQGSSMIEKPIGNAATGPGQPVKLFAVLQTQWTSLNTAYQDSIGGEPPRIWRAQRGQVLRLQRQWCME